MKRTTETNELEGLKARLAKVEETLKEKGILPSDYNPEPPKQQTSFVQRQVPREWRGDPNAAPLRLLEETGDGVIDSAANAVSANVQKRFDATLGKVTKIGAAPATLQIKKQGDSYIITVVPTIVGAKVDISRRAILGNMGFSSEEAQKAKTSGMTITIGAELMEKVLSRPMPQETAEQGRG